MRIVFYATPRPGHLFPPVPPARGARDQGHGVAVFASAGLARRLAEAV